MAFSQEWETVYRDGKQRATWPWSDVISLVKGQKLPTGARVLELGCGAGANIPFFLADGYEYVGIDGSDSIIAQLRQRFPQLTRHLFAGDFTASFPEGPYRLILDRASVACNREADIRSCIRKIYDALEPGGLFIGIDWYSTSSDAARMGVDAGDGHSRTGFISGPFTGLGVIHFSDKDHILDLFRGFEILHLQEKLLTTHHPAVSTLGGWAFVARKPDTE
jgi:SAM-dependent methyltransferase